MYKLMVLIKRRQGMSMEEFKDYYESNHSVLAAGNLPHIVEYKRSYLSPLGSHTGDGTDELPYDVVTELVFEDKAGFQTAMEILGRPEVQAEIVADEEKLFDRSTITFMEVEEHATDMSLYR